MKIFCETVLLSEAKSAIIERIIGLVYDFLEKEDRKDCREGD